MPWQQVLVACRKVMNKMGFDLVHDAGGYLIGHIPVRHGKGCDIVTVYVREIGSALITSENKTQDFDGGRNRERVESFIIMLEAGIYSTCVIPKTSPAS